MAPRGEDGARADTAGFTVIPALLSGSGGAARQLLVKPHRARETAARRPQDRTLFVLTPPPYCTQESVHRLFSQCGTVISVELQDKPGPGAKSEAKKSKFFSRKPAEGYRVGYVVFKSPAGMKSALKPQTPWILSPSEHPVTTGLQKWIQDYRCNITDTEALQKEVDDFMKKHDQRVAAMEARAGAEDGVPDEEGWVKVTRKGRRPGVPRTEARNLQAVQREKRKRQQRELLNFYSWQQQDAKREHIAQLRKKFEEDKQKIALMRAERKFKPY
ncbi:ribosomal RNA-processing protein 7 homolog A [Leucoraja erinacea]|uniref:ribosomal RNA-processing protein 7 homolog A n=1 Tax=Leucoraja erinaceus TaxID=7782 RepID=UPI0024585F11|nr:ribosomal RNA-processing protein 7 homolog A [Leucoraja erinacea]